MSCFVQCFKYLLFHGQIWNFKTYSKFWKMQHCTYCELGTYVDRYLFVLLELKNWVGKFGKNVESATLVSLFTISNSLAKALMLLLCILDELASDAYSEKKIKFNWQKSHFKSPIFFGKGGWFTYVNIVSSVSPPISAIADKLIPLIYLVSIRKKWKTWALLIGHFRK